MTAIRLETLTKKFGKRGEVVAVDALDLEIEDGEFIALLGPSGCGKSTTLLMLSGIYQPTEGTIYFDDVIINGVAPKHRFVGLVFQSYALYPHMSVYDNIAFPLKLIKRPRKEIRNKVQSISELVQIEELLKRKPNQLSGGQQQRVALCRALIKEPSLLLLDEPLSNLDARLRIETRTQIKKIQKELGITTILVTHDQVEALTMADRIAVISKGKLQQYTTPQALYDQPNTLFVASFIGDPPMNLFEVVQAQEEGVNQLRSQKGDFALTLDASLTDRLKHTSPKTPLMLGLRPDDMRLSREEIEGSILGQVDLVEPLGGANLVHFDFDGLAFRTLAPVEFQAKVEERLWIMPQSKKIHLFEKETGKSLAGA